MTLFSVNAFFVMMVLLLGREFFLISESLHISSLYLLLVVILNLIVVFHAFRYKKKQIETQLNTVNNPEYEFEIKVLDLSIETLSPREKTTMIICLYAL